MSCVGSLIYNFAMAAVYSAYSALLSIADEFNVCNLSEKVRHLIHYPKIRRGGVIFVLPYDFLNTPPSAFHSI